MKEVKACSLGIIASLKEGKDSKQIASKKGRTSNLVYPVVNNNPSISVYNDDVVKNVEIGTNSITPTENPFKGKRSSQLSEIDTISTSCEAMSVSSVQKQCK